MVRRALLARQLRLSPERRRAEEHADPLRRRRTARSPAARPLPILTVDEAIYRRLPAFVIATVDKFAGLPWLAEAGAFFGNVDREDEWGFYGAADGAREGRPLFGGREPPAAGADRSGRAASDQRAARHGRGALRDRARSSGDAHARREARSGRRWSRAPRRCVGRRRRSRRCSTASRTEVFPPPGPDRRDSFFAKTVPSAEKPARLYVGLASPGKGPKLIFLRALLSLLAAAQKEADAGADGRSLSLRALLLQRPARTRWRPPDRRGRGHGEARDLRRRATTRRSAGPAVRQPSPARSPGADVAREHRQGRRGEGTSGEGRDAIRRASTSRWRPT